jgi:hypothetical protein
LLVRNARTQPILEPPLTPRRTPQPCDDPPVRPPTVRRPTNRTQTHKSNLGGLSGSARQRQRPSEAF